MILVIEHLGKWTQTSYLSFIHSCYFVKTKSKTKLSTKSLVILTETHDGLCHSILLTSVCRDICITFKVSINSLIKLVYLANNRVFAARLPHSRLACHATAIAILSIAAGARLNVVFASLFLSKIVTTDIMK